MRSGMVIIHPWESDMVRELMERTNTRRVVGIGGATRHELIEQLKETALRDTQSEFISPITGRIQLPKFPVGDVERWRPGMPRYAVRTTIYNAYRVFDFQANQFVGNASEDRGTANASARKLNKETHD